MPFEYLVATDVGPGTNGSQEIVSVTSVALRGKLFG